MNARHLNLKACGLLLCVVLLVSVGCDDSDSNNGGSTEPQFCSLSGQAALAADGGQPGPIEVKLLKGTPPALYAETLTNRSGGYFFADLPYGRYIIVFESELYDEVDAALSLFRPDYTYNVQVTVRFPQILEAHGSVLTLGGVKHYTFYDVRVYDEVGINKVEVLLIDSSGETSIVIELEDTDADGDYEVMYEYTGDIEFMSSFAIRVTDTDGNMTEALYTFE